MKRIIDKNGRILYKFAHSVCQGGFVYVHKTKSCCIIGNKEGLRSALEAASRNLELIDTTIKVYDTVFFLFFMTKPALAPIQIISEIQKSVGSLASWHDEYGYTGIEDLQEKSVRWFLSKGGFDYEKG